jgi:hypothetical protein
MYQALLVEKLGVNPLIALDVVSFESGTDLHAQIHDTVEKHNAQGGTKAEGALIWSPGDYAERYEYFTEESALRRESHGATAVLRETYTTAKGNKFWFYGKCVSWVPGKRSFWEIYLYHHDKKFTYDGIFDSPDLLAKLGEDYPPMNCHIEILKAESLFRARQAIEDWDHARCGH